MTQQQIDEFKLLVQRRIAYGKWKAPKPDDSAAIKSKELSPELIRRRELAKARQKRHREKHGRPA